MEEEPKKRKSRRKLKIFKNPDKAWHEEWTPKRNIMNIPHPHRFYICGRPNSGKTSFIFNLILKQSPPFQELIVLHCDPEYTKEYDDLGAIFPKNIPSPDSFEGKKKTLVVLDDIDYKSLNKEQQGNLDRLFGFVSTHKNISVYLTAQDAFTIPPSVRRCASGAVLWRMHDVDALQMMGRKLNYTGKELLALMDKHIENSHDCIMIDNTHKTPYPLRKNGVIPIEKISVGKGFY